MSKLSWKSNLITGQLEADFRAKLISIGDNVLELNNKHKTPYVLCTIEMPSGKQVSGRMYQKNAEKCNEETIGQQVLCKATQYDGGIDITVSHLTSAPRVTLAEFEEEFGAVEVPAAAAATN